MKETTTQRKRRLEKARRKYHEKLLQESEEDKAKRLKELRYRRRMRRLGLDKHAIKTQEETAERDRTAQARSNMTTKTNNTDGSPWEPSRNSTICSRHFVDNEKSEHPRSPSYNPTIRWEQQFSNYFGSLSSLCETSMEAMDTDPDVVVVEYDEVIPQKDDSDDMFEIDDDIDITEMIKDCMGIINVKKLMKSQIAEISTKAADVEEKCVSTNSVFDTLFEQVKVVRNSLDVDDDSLTALGDINISNRALENPEMHIDNRSFVNASATTSQSMKTYSRSTNSSGDLEVIVDIQVKNFHPKLPLPGPVIKPEVTVGMRVHAMKASFFGVWYRARVMEIKTNGDLRMYKVKFETRKLLNQTKILSGKHLAYSSPPNFLIPVGTRAIAQYRDEYRTHPPSMYAGIVAEPPKKMNNFRYLVFFDDGYAQYVEHKDLCLVCEVSACVWDDIHPDSTEFIKKYLKEYPERPMVKLQAGQTVRTEWNGHWWVANVTEVDASLAKMYFISDKRSEWIYRGSTRLGPLYSELANAEANKHSGKMKRHNVKPKTKDAPYVEYTRGFDDQMDDGNWQSTRRVARKHTQRLNVARKSSTLPARNSFGSIDNQVREYDGIVEIRTNMQFKPSRAIKPHDCNASCIAGCDEDPKNYKGKNPFQIPMMVGWERQIVKHKSMGKRVVFYCGPCGRRCRSIEDVHQYLQMTNSSLPIDYFCMDIFVHMCGEFVPNKAECSIKDISYGLENIAVSCVNGISKQYPEHVEYSTKRMPHTGVTLNLDPQFLVGCACTDDCFDTSNCSCHKLTMEATKCAPGGGSDDKYIGYQFRRLYTNVITGVYECNSNCACSSRCLNRVAQNGLQLRLQVFKTEKMGWGLRCIDDVPQGAFICTYVGRLLTDEGANEGGTQFGDEYLAELDYIEVVERLKEGYESDAVEPDDEVLKSDKCAKPKAKASVDSPPEESESEADVARSEDSSDSDFEFNVGPIAPREHVTRNKERVPKTVLRRNSNNQEMEEGCHNDGGEMAGSSCNEETESNASTTPSKTPCKANADKRNTPLKLAENAAKCFALKPMPLSQKTLDALKNTQLQRIPKVPKDKKIDLVMSDSEDDNSKASKSSSIDTGDENSNNKLPVVRSLFGSLSVSKKTSEGESNQGTSHGEKNLPKRSARSYFGEEFCYIMDAKSTGNIGRYLNHSCSPNVFVQNVFVDTHDIRFPWVAFFSSQYIRAGSELTWDYSYEVGSVAGKVLYCFCGASECRGRLL